MAEMMLQTAAVFSLINVLLLIGLIGVYGNSFRKIQAEFTAALLFFAGVFLLQNLLALYAYVAMFMYYAPGVGMLVLAITVAQTAGLAVLLWMSLR
jgi:predicted membrane protein